MVTCPNCGQDNIGSAAQCSACGYRLITPIPSPHARSFADLPPPPTGAATPGYPEYRPMSGYFPSQAGYPPSQVGVPFGIPMVVLFREQLTSRQKTRQFFAGLGLGAIPLILELLVLGATLASVAHVLPSIDTLSLVVVTVFFLAIGLFIAALVFAIVLLIQPARRFMGGGMLASVLASPVIFFISYIAVFAISCKITYC